MLRHIGFCFLILVATCSLFGCGSMVTPELHTASVLAVLDDDPVAPTTHETQTTRASQTYAKADAATIPASCDSYRARFRRPISTRDGMRVYCF
jgi:hypothetical protein